MALVPPQLVPAVRAGLVSQGFPAATIGDDGLIDPGALFSGAYSTISFHSQLTPKISISTAGVTDGKPSWFPSLVKPTVVFSGRAGRAVFAPYGKPNEWSGTAVFVGAAVALVWGGYLMGKAAR